MALKLMMANWTFVILTFAALGCNPVPFGSLHAPANVLSDSSRIGLLLASFLYADATNANRIAVGHRKSDDPDLSFLVNSIAEFVQSQCEFVSGQGQLRFVQQDAHTQTKSIQYDPIYIFRSLNDAVIQERFESFDELFPSTMKKFLSRFLGSTAEFVDLAAHFTHNHWRMDVPIAYPEIKSCKSWKEVVLVCHLDQGDDPGQWMYPNEECLPSFTWVFDVVKHVVTLQVHVHIKPANTTSEQVEVFKDLLERQVEEHFNNNSYILIPKNEGDPWTPQIDVIIEDVSTGIDIELHNEEVQSSVNWDTPEEIDAVMNIEDLLYGGDEQVSAVHEFGHIIGCRHPGEPGGEDEYTADEDCLMGLGMELRPIYFAAWAIELSEHLPQDGPYGVGEQ